jgi:exosortase C (VPDSG-CTERM-specific)
LNPSFNRFALAAGALTLAFAGLLWQLFVFAIADDLYSYIPLIPFVSGYLAWTFRASLPRPGESAPARGLAAVLFAGGAAALAGYFALARHATPAAYEDSLAAGTLAWVLGLGGVGCWFLGGATMRTLAYPFGLLLFMVPLPMEVRNGLETVLQHGSAVVADWMFVLSGAPVLCTGLQFQLPDISIMVAPECSGIHSTWVLFITSVVAGRLVLRRPWRRAVLCLIVLPLALLRNGFRVFVIGQLCIHIGPQMIHSPIHHRGGPIFFGLSLIPFFLVLYFLRRSEGRPAGGKIEDRKAESRKQKEDH